MALLTRLKQRLFRWRSDGSVPFRLGQRRIFIMPSGGGLLYALTLLVMLIGSINYDLALGHALVFLLVGLGLAGMLHTFRNLHGLRVATGRCPAVFAGQKAYFELLLGNERSTSRLDLQLAATDNPSVTCGLAAATSTPVAIPVAAGQRGWLVLPRVRISTRYPLGLFVAWSYLQPAMRCLVYPRPIVSPLPAASPGTHVGERNGENGQEDFAGFRQRQPADSPRHVAWKASARNAGEAPLLVKQFAGGAEAERWLEWTTTAPTQPLETRLSLLAGWVLAAEAAGHRYGLRLPHREIPPAQGAAHQQDCLAALALFSA